MELNLRGKVVFITGSSRGIGKSVAEAFAKEGANIVINGINSETLENTKNELSEYPVKILAARGNLSNEEEAKVVYKQIEKEFGFLDILINNAAVVLDKPFMEMSLEEWQHVFRNNLDSMFISTQLAVKLMRKERSPVIINGGAFSGKLPSMGYSAYGATKAAITNFTYNIAAELAGYGIRVLGYAPGVTKTDMNKELFMREPKRLIVQIPLARIAEPTEIADAVVYMASEKASYICGTMIEINGGKLCVQNVDRYRD